MAETERCSVQGCRRSAAASLDLYPYCREHFLSTCYERLDQCKDRLAERPSHDTTPESVRKFLIECSRQAADLALGIEDLDNLERARLLDILLWTGELSSRLRRSSRKAASVPVRLSSAKPSQLWEEDTQTLMLSRHGALVECQHPAEMGETILLMRRDTGRQARARVAWRQRGKENRLEVGIEILDCENFWELEWDTAESVA